MCLAVEYTPLQPLSSSQDRWREWQKRRRRGSKRSHANPGAPARRGKRQQLGQVKRPSSSTVGTPAGLLLRPPAGPEPRPRREQVSGSARRCGGGAGGPLKDETESSVRKRNSILVALHPYKRRVGVIYWNHNCVLVVLQPFERRLQAFSIGSSSNIFVFYVVLWQASPPGSCCILFSLQSASTRQFLRSLPISIY